MAYVEEDELFVYMLFNDSEFGNGTNYDNFDYYDIGYRWQLLSEKPYKIIAIILCLLSFIFNATGLIGIAHVKKRLNPRLMFFVSLGFSDIFVSLSTFLHIVSRVLNPIYSSAFTICSYVILRGMTCTANVISLLNLFGMAIIHFLAVKKPLRYRTSITTTHARWMLALFWLLSWLVGYADLFIGLVDYDFEDGVRVNYCEHVRSNHFHSQQIMFATAFVCFVAMAYLYGKIFHKMKVRRSFARESSSHAHTCSAQNTYRNNRKAILTTLLIFGTFFMCWIPLTMLEIALLIRAKLGLIDSESVPVLLMVNEYLHDLLLLNSLCDPIIYIMRVRDVRAGFERFKRRCCRCFRRFWWLLMSIGNATIDPPLTMSTLNTERTSSNNLHVAHELIESL